MTKRETLQKRINRYQMIVNGLEDSEAWREVVNDFNVERKRMDDNWQKVRDEKQWHEWRITKLAIMKIINIIDDYKNDIRVAKEEINKIDNPDKKIRKDVDNE